MVSPGLKSQSAVYFIAAKHLFTRYTCVIPSSSELHVSARRRHLRRIEYAVNKMLFVCVPLMQSNLLKRTQKFYCKYLMTAIGIE